MRTQIKTSTVSSGVEEEWPPAGSGVGRGLAAGSRGLCLQTGGGLLREGSSGRTRTRHEDNGPHKKDSSPAGTELREGPSGRCRRPADSKCCGGSGTLSPCSPARRCVALGTDLYGAQDGRGRNLAASGPRWPAPSHGRPGTPGAGQGQEGRFGRVTPNPQPAPAPAASITGQHSPGASSWEKWSHTGGDQGQGPAP